MDPINTNGTTVAALDSVIAALTVARNDARAVIDAEPPANPASP